MAKILAIDDNSETLRLYQLLFGEKGYEVVLAHDGKEGVERLKKDIGLILLDCVMPVYDGKYFLEELSNRDFTNRPVISVSALPERFVRENYKLYDKRINRYITLPFNPDTLVEKVAALIKR
jgi:DNA-binding response OmpR family regulator